MNHSRIVFITHEGSDDFGLHSSPTKAHLSTICVQHVEIPFSGCGKKHRPERPLYSKRILLDVVALRDVCCPTATDACVHRIAVLILIQLLAERSALGKKDVRASTS